MQMKNNHDGSSTLRAGRVHAIAHAAATVAVGMVPALWVASAQAQAAGNQASSRVIQAAPALPRTACTSVTSAQPVFVSMGKSQVVSLGAPAVRLIGAGRPSSWIGQAVRVEEKSPADMRNSGVRPVTPIYDGIAETEITLLSPNEVLIVGHRQGTANMIVQDKEGRCVVRDIVVTIDPAAVQAKLNELMPTEKGIKVSGADNGFVLTGTVSDPIKLDQAINLVSTYGDGKKVVNMLRVDAPSQVMLEVKIAEVSKSLIDKFGLDYSRAYNSNGSTNVISGIIGGKNPLLGSFNPAGTITGTAASTITGGLGAIGTTVGAGNVTGGTLIGANMQKQDGVVRVLAEPSILAISGQSASFLSGGKIFIPVPQASASGSFITLEEKEFGVGLKFTPTVLDGGRINLKLVSEASELSQTGAAFSTVGNVTSVLPAISTRRVDTTVQLGDGQSFAVAGLVKNNLNETLKRTPGLGEIPILGALFRSNEFQTDQTELMFVITPRLVKPLASAIALPTDNHVAPNRTEAVFGNRGEGDAPAEKADQPNK